MSTVLVSQKLISMESTLYRAVGFAALASSALLAANLVSAQIPTPTDAPKPMSPEQSAAAFKLPEGFRMEVVASEPLIASPSAVCWDERGRMFVSELHGYKRCQNEAHGRARHSATAGSWETTRVLKR